MDIISALGCREQWSSSVIRFIHGLNHWLSSAIRMFQGFTDGYAEPDIYNHGFKLPSGHAQNANHEQLRCARSGSPSRFDYAFVALTSRASHPNHTLRTRDERVCEMRAKMTIVPV